MTKIEDYLHLYLGCEGQYYAGYGRHGKQWVKAKLVGFTSQGNLILICYDKEGKEWGYDVVSGYDEFKPLLRPLSSMTEEEYSVWVSKRSDGDPSNATVYFAQTEAEKTKYLLSKGFDLFGLIEAGLAISDMRSTEASQGTIIKEKPKP